MLTYVYIALGGALGSVGRAWTTNVMVRAVGAHFPWGTILINVLGSFIIGLFAALTASDGRFPAHADARAFVMIGICGGYTTFSAFSLQTLDLLRDGKPAAALANIGLSVVLCLLAVTAGYGSGTVFNHRSSERPQGSEKSAGGKIVLAVLDRPEPVGSVLSAASRLLDFGGERIEALAVRTPPIAAMMIADQILTTAEEDRLRAVERARVTEVKAAFDGWLTQAKAKTIEAGWIDAEGDVAHLVAEHGRRSAALVLAQNAPRAERGSDALHAALFDTSRPVLIVPPYSAGSFGRVVAVAWKDDAHAPKAVIAAMPILAKADVVHVLQAGVSGQQFGIPPLLLEHGIKAQSHSLLDDYGVTGAALLKLAHELGADLLVMGAYAHGEWREALLGGVTRYMLRHADLPLLMQH